MLIKRPEDLKYSDVTDERLYLRRREFIQLGAGRGTFIGIILATARWTRR